MENVLARRHVRVRFSDFPQRLRSVLPKTPAAEVAPLKSHGKRASGNRVARPRCSFKSWRISSVGDHRFARLKLLLSARPLLFPKTKTEKPFKSVENSSLINQPRPF